MIFFKKTFQLLIVFLVLTSCSKEPVDSKVVGEHTVKFSASVESPLTRATATKWEENDAIGVYALNGGQTLSTSSIYDNKANIQYTTSEAGNTGNFTVANTAEAIELPGNGNNLDFVAYYPYTTSVTDDYQINLDVSDQSDLTNIDFLYAKKTNQNKSNPNVELVFSHKLSKVIVNLEKQGDDISLENATVTIKSAITDGSFNLATEAVTLGNNKANISASMDNTTNTATAILVPGQQMSDVVIKVTLADGKEYEWTPQAYALESGKSRTYPLTLTSGNVTANTSGTINDWENSGNTGGATIDPNAKEGISANKTSINFVSTATSTQIAIDTTPNTLTWTANSNANWLTISDDNGTGDTSITVNATENTTATERTGVITITPNNGEAITIQVSQAAGSSSTPSATVLFPGSDFENWSDFQDAVTDLESYVEQNNEGRNNSKALYINTTPSGNDYLFKSKVPSGFTAPTSKISFYIKGTSPSKSLSINLYKTDGKKYYKFNLGDCNTDKVINGTAGTNQYKGTIDTNNQWVKVTLDLTGITDINTTADGKLFAIKVGNNSAYNLSIDDITME